MSTAPERVISDANEDKCGSISEDRNCEINISITGKPSLLRKNATCLEGKYYEDYLATKFLPPTTTNNQPACKQVNSD